MPVDMGHWAQPDRHGVGGALVLINCYVVAMSQSEKEQKKKRIIMMVLLAILLLIVTYIGVQVTMAIKTPVAFPKENFKYGREYI